MIIDVPAARQLGCRFGQDFFFGRPPGASGAVSARDDRAEQAERHLRPSGCARGSGEMHRRPASVTVAVALIVALVSGCITVLSPVPGTTGTASGTLSVGDAVAVAAATIGDSGGTITVGDAGGPLAGLDLQVPSGAYGTPRDFVVSYRPITGHSYDERIKPISPLISIENGGEYADQVMSLKVPVDVPEGQFAMGFFYDEDTGVLEGMPLLAEDDVSVTIGTRHFSEFFISSILQSVLLNITVDSGFRPGVDDWQFTNYGSYIARGHCAGQSISAIWYYYERKLRGEADLYGRYDNYLSDEEKTPDLWKDDNLAYRLASTVQKDIDFYTLSAELSYSVVGIADTLQLLSFAYAFHVTHNPQLVGLVDSVQDIGHAIVAYKIDRGTIWIADPNFPGEKSADGKIEFVNGAFKPYRSALSADSDPTNFDKIGYLAVTAFVDWEAVGARFAQMENGAVGNEYFPAYDFSGRSDAAPDPLPLVDGVSFPDDKFALDWASTFDLRGVVYREGQLLPLSGLVVPLQPGENKLGIAISGLTGTDAKGNDIYKYIDFYRVTVIYNKVTISPDPITGNAGDDLSMTATMPAQVTDARYEWDYGDGTPKENLSLEAMHVFADEGEYTVTLSVYDDTTDRLMGRGTAVAQIGAGAATPTTTAQAGAGAWVLKLVETDIDKSEEVFSFSGLACSGGAKATSTETGATIVTTGGCQATGALVANETTQHSWSRPPDQLTPGQELTVTLTASSSGLCSWTVATTEENCRPSVTTRHGVALGDGQPWAQQEWNYSDLIYDSTNVGESANARDRPTAAVAWTVPDGHLSGKTLLLQFTAGSNAGRVRTNFWYEWQEP